MSNSTCAKPEDIISNERFAKKYGLKPNDPEQPYKIQRNLKGYKISTYGVVRSAEEIAEIKRKG